eukprot:3702499-Pyramimonas_sp.AAC.1
MLRSFARQSNNYRLGGRRLTGAHRETSYGFSPCPTGTTKSSTEQDFEQQQTDLHQSANQIHSRLRLRDQEHQSFGEDICYATMQHHSEKTTQLRRWTASLADPRHRRDGEQQTR